MKKLHLLAIPIIVGIVVGMFLVVYPQSEEDTKLLTSSRLIDDGSPILGDPNAPITILEWGDYQCTFCYKFHQNTLDTIIEDHIKTGKVKLVFKDFPLNGPDSILAAEAAYCADDQEKYWQYHNELYKNWGGERTGWVTRESLEKFATTVNLNLDEFNKCLDSHKYQNRVNTLYEFGKEVGIDATPSFLVFNDHKIIKIRGNQPLEVFLKTIDEL
ncbi:DSBA-like thioredoxin domain protein [Candidatus Nitrosopumilus salaria BD31]|uniref:DSBA-like thioredoxin domain protein n=1 Tax=Candidatus Nitrosopumilus salarius BD31 TaxID=859350 RepID=I3D3Q9_9ARCH|nr:thioredoxin domain-containing protein [Candidatus Nitrosopumilus salaria]EIJ66352.1 DSBA-like thioredoxin domain protein [Candidatus Nitrosopumilus salaria BD31]